MDWYIAFLKASPILRSSSWDWKFSSPHSMSSAWMKSSKLDDNFIDKLFSVEVALGMEMVSTPLWLWPSRTMWFGQWYHSDQAIGTNAIVCDADEQDPSHMNQQIVSSILSSRSISSSSKFSNSAQKSFHFDLKKSEPEKTIFRARSLFLFESFTAEGERKYVGTRFSHLDRPIKFPWSPNSFFSWRNISLLHSRSYRIPPSFSSSLVMRNRWEKWEIMFRRRIIHWTLRLRCH